jgi:hypothetical protein
MNMDMNILEDRIPRESTNMETNIAEDRGPTVTDTTESLVESYIESSECQLDTMYQLWITSKADTDDEVSSTATEDIRCITPVQKRTTSAGFEPAPATRNRYVNQHSSLSL